MEQFQEQTKSRTYCRINGTHLKWVALWTMLIDHIGFVLLQEAVSVPAAVYTICRGIGRISFPIFCFLLVEGFWHTGNVRKYLLRLTLFALLAEIPYDLAINGKVIDLSGQNVLFAFVIGVGMMWALRTWNTGLGSVGEAVILVMAMAVCAVVRADYSYFGPLLIYVLYRWHEIPWKRNVIMAALLFWEPMALWSIPIIQCYNGERGKGHKYFFYWFYPVHLLCLWAVYHIVMLAR